MFAPSDQVVADSVPLQIDRAVSENQIVATLSGFCFGKNKRLLNSADFKSVFDGAKFKAPHKNLLVLANPAATDSPRLGLVVAKKNAKLAVQRNRIKRLTRDSFRLNQAALEGLDIVVLSKHDLWRLDNAQITELLEQAWKRLIKQRNKYRASLAAESP